MLTRIPVTLTYAVVLTAVTTVLLALAELFWRSRQLVLTFTLGHLGATLLVALGLAVAVKLGWTPASVSRDIDVGMSYGAATVLGALTAAIPRAGVRPGSVGGWPSGWPSSR